MKRACLCVIAAVAACLAPGVVTAAQPGAAYNLADSPVAARGHMSAIAGGDGHSGYVDEAGWYNLLSPSGAVETGLDDGLQFQMDGPTQVSTLRIKRFPMDDFADFSAEQLEAATADMIVPGSAAEADIGAPIAARSLVPLANADGSGRHKITAAVWDVVAPELEPKGVHAVFAIVVTRKGKLVMVCTTDSQPTTCHNLLQDSLSMEQAAY